MDNTPLFSVMAGLAISALIAIAIYRWAQRERVRRVGAWIEDYLSLNSNVVPLHLNINCSDDRSWPVLVEFDDARTGARHNLQFTCAGLPSSFRLVSETKQE